MSMKRRPFLLKALWWLSLPAVGLAQTPPSPDDHPCKPKGEPPNICAVWDSVNCAWVGTPFRNACDEEVCEEPPKYLNDCCRQTDGVGVPFNNHDKECCYGRLIDKVKEPYYELPKASNPFPLGDVFINKTSVIFIAYVPLPEPGQYRGLYNRVTTTATITGVMGEESYILLENEDGGCERDMPQVDGRWVETSQSISIGVEFKYINFQFTHNFNYSGRFNTAKPMVAAATDKRTYRLEVKREKRVLAGPGSVSGIVVTEHDIWGGYPRRLCPPSGCVSEQVVDGSYTIPASGWIEAGLEYIGNYRTCCIEK